jgi:glycosyltransferase involved in cell wall biosynthesis
MPHTLLILHQGGSHLRGSEEVLLNLLRHVDRSRWTPLVLHDDAVLAEPLRDLGVEGERWDLPGVLSGADGPPLPLRAWWRALRRLRALCRARPVDAVFCNGGGPCQLGVPAAAPLRIPLVCLMHHPAPRRLHAAWLTRFAGTLLYASRYTAEHTRARIGRNGPVVYPGVDALGRFAPPPVRDPAVRAALGLRPDDVVFAQAGALVPHKGHAVLLEAFARVAAALPAARLLVVGDGPERARLEADAARRGVADRVVFTGYVDDPAPLFRHGMDVGVLASREEGLGLVSLQAAACGLPAIGSDCTGIREAVVHGQTGLLVPPGEVPALAAAMLRLGRDPALRRRMGASGRLRVIEHFSAERSAARMQEAIADAVRAAGREAAAPPPRPLRTAGGAR